MQKREIKVQKNKKFGEEKVREYWTEQAVKHKRSYAASWSDKMAIELEIKEIAKRLSDGDNVLDIGCANGYSTLNFARQKRITIKGLDYIPEMIKEANLSLGSLKSNLAGTAEFGVGDITGLKEQPESYDKVISIRVLINLVDWEHQKKGLQECARVLKKGGILLLSEATLQGWNNLNKFRTEWNLPNIPMPPFNCYLDQDKVTEAVSGELELVELVNFSSSYFVGTRVLKPLIIQALGARIDAANPNMEWNSWFAQLPAFGDYGTQKLFVFRKK